MKQVQLPADLAGPFIELILKNLANWPIKTAASFRNALLGDYGVFTLNPILGIEKPDDVRYINTMMKTIIAEGRMIDFGNIPNKILKQESLRSRTMFESNELIHPYDSWCGVTSWEGGMNAYFIFPNPLRPVETVVVETYGVSVPDIGDVIIVYDVVDIKVKESGTLIAPLPGVMPQSDEEIRKRGANSLDPLVTMLRLLADASIPVVDVGAPAKLNKCRAKQGKFTIPAHMVVETKDYVAQMLTTKNAPRGEGQGGHHASPTAHWRRAHKRTLASGRTVPVRSSKVNWRQTEEFHRLFYRVKEKE